MRPEKIRHHLSLDPKLSRELEKLCRSAGTTKSNVLAKALEAFIETRGESELDQRYGLRLDRISRELNRVARDVEIALESLALFIRFMITLNAHTPAPDKATQAIARERFQNFVDQVSRQIAGGNKTLRPDERENGE